MVMLGKCERLVAQGRRSFALCGSRGDIAMHLPVIRMQRQPTVTVTWGMRQCRIVATGPRPLACVPLISLAKQRRITSLGDVEMFQGRHHVTVEQESVGGSEWSTAVGLP